MHDEQDLIDHAARWVTPGALRSFFAPRLGIDARALGAFRIALALLVLADLVVYRAPELTTFYTDEGVVPRAMLAEQFPTLAAWSLHALSGAAWFQAVLFALAGGVAIALLVGYRTRLATGVSVLLLASLFARNPYVLNGGDTILLSLLFLGLFLPLGARWSIDARRRGGRRRRELSVATATPLLFLVVVYASNAAFKYVSDPWMSGVAVRQIFHLEHHIVRAGPLLADFPALLTALNWLWVGTLTASVLLVVVTDRLRIALVAAFVAAHLGMAATMRLGLFPFVTIAGLLLFLPPRVWERVEEAVPDQYQGSPQHTRGPDRKPGSAAPAIPPGARRLLRLIGAVALLGFLGAVILMQGSAVGVVDHPASATGSSAAEYGWTMFGPDLPDADGWYVAEAELESGEKIDLLGGGEAEFDRPADSADAYPSVLWHRYLGELRYADSTQYEPVAAYLCERTDRDVETLTVYYVEQPVDSAGPDGEPIVHERIEYAC